MKIIEKMNENYPKQLLKISKPPERLYLLGDEKLLCNTSLAIVGSRNCSEYGKKYAKEFAKVISETGITIISGLALGIDSIAHKSSMNCKGKTIAVVGCGLNHIYPEENRELAKSILANGGCIISEYEPEEPINMENFPKRNRIISGIASKVLVIEAIYRSGSRITGRLGLEQGKDVFCLPRDINVPNGVGTNELIKKGAKLVTSPYDILQEYGLKYSKEEISHIAQEYEKEKSLTEKGKNKKDIDKKEIGKKEDRKNNIVANIPKEYISIYQFVSDTPKNIQYFVNKSGLKVAEVTQKLIMLELQGYIKSMPRELLH